MLKEYLERQFANYHAITSGYVTPEMFGAKGDGVTDDTQAFTRAFASSRNVKCLPNKRYYFADIVDASQLKEGTLDINGSTLLNFHIKVAMKNEYMSNLGQSAPSRPFSVKNGRIGEYNVRPTGWETPIIQSGTKLELDGLYFGNMPYICALTNMYLDNMVFRNLLMSIRADKWTDIESLSLDAVNLIKQDGTFTKINNYDGDHIPSDLQNFAGDCWNIEGVNEFSILMYPEYAFCHFRKNTALMINKCIQSHFVIGTYCQATFLDCHFEKPMANPEIYNLENATETSVTTNEKVISFINCYFYDHYTLATKLRNVAYYNCYFRTTIASPLGIPLADVLGGLDWYDIKCKISNCSFGGNYIVDTEMLARWRSIPKRTRSWHNGNNNNEHLMSARIPKTATLGVVNKPEDGHAYIYPRIGTYNYTIVSFTTGTQIAHEVYECQREVVSVNSKALENNTNIQGLDGGWHFEVYRTVPAIDDKPAIIQRAIFYADPYDRFESGQVAFRFKDMGTFLNVVYKVGDAENSIPLPWINVTEIPTYSGNKVNPLVYEKNGVLVSTDDSYIQGNARTSKYAQVSDTYSVPN